METCRPTTHSDPVFVVENIVHYCVANLPGTVPLTSTYALTNASLPYALEIADKGYQKAAADNHEIALGINMMDGNVTNQKIAETFGLELSRDGLCSLQDSVFH